MSEYNRLVAVNSSNELPPAVQHRLSMSSFITNMVRNSRPDALVTVERRVASLFSEIELLKNRSGRNDIQVLTPDAGVSVTYTLRDLDLQLLVIKIGPSGIASITHPAGITWKDDLLPIPSPSSPSILVLGFVRTASREFTGYVIHGGV